MNFCTSCGTPRSNQDNFCEKCGKNFDSDNSNEVNVQETLHPASGWKTPYDPELEKSKDLDSSPFQGSVPRKRLMIASVAIIAIFIGSATLYFSGLIGGNASESKKTSDYIQSWLLSNGFCTDVLGSSTCYYEDDAYPQRDDLAENYPYYTLPVTFRILTGDVNVPDYALKESIYTDDWVIQLETHEVAFPGTFDKGREMMKQIASGLNGKLHSGYHPRDFCTFEIYYISERKLYDKSFRPSAEQDAIISECRKYFPEAPKEEFRH